MFFFVSFLWFNLKLREQFSSRQYGETKRMEEMLLYFLKIVNRIIYKSVHFYRFIHGLRQYLFKIELPEWNI